MEEPKEEDIINYIQQHPECNKAVTLTKPTKFSKIILLDLDELEFGWLLNTEEVKLLLEGLKTSTIYSIRFGLKYLYDWKRIRDHLDKYKNNHLQSIVITKYIESLIHSRMFSLKAINEALDGRLVKVRTFYFCTAFCDCLIVCPK